MDSLQQYVNTIYKLTEATRVQARAATAIYEKLEFLNTRYLKQEDETVTRTNSNPLESLQSMDSALPKLRKQRQKMQHSKLSSCPQTLKHLQPQQSSGDKKYAFGEDFLEQYYDETFKQQITSQSTNNRGGFTKKFNSHGYSGRGGHNYDQGGSRPFRGRGRGAWSHHQQTNRSFAPPTDNSPSDNPQ